MPKFNKRGTRPQVRTPIKSTGPSGTTFEGHQGYARDPKSELFLLGACNFVNVDTFYEQAKDRDNRYVNLVRQVTITDPVWMLRFVRWLRNEANMRSAALVAGLEAARAVVIAAPGVKFMGKAADIDNKQGLARQLAKAGIRRADEPGEALAYWISKYGRPIPKPIKRAIADKARELYTEWTLLRYDTATHGFRFGDVIELTRPNPRPGFQSDLFRHAIERRHNRSNGIPENLTTLHKNSLLREEVSGVLGMPEPGILLNPQVLREAGMAWEDVLSLAGNKLPKKDLWEALIPTMGYMALLRNLRNFDQAGVADKAAEYVAGRLADPDQVARSRQLPMRFLSAYRNVPSLRWSWPLEQALNHCLASIPVLSGRTLILVDTSGSMRNLFTSRSELARWDVASLFGITFGLRAADATVVSFSSSSKVFPIFDGGSVLSSWKRWRDNGFNLNSGTDTVLALRRHFQGHDRVIIVTDEQASGGYDAFGRYRRYGSALDPSRYMAEVNSVVPVSAPMHVINVAGYEKGMVPSGSDNRHVYGGLSDQMFTLIPTVEAGVTGHWPWETPGV